MIAAGLLLAVMAGQADAGKIDLITQGVAPFFTRVMVKMLADTKGPYGPNPPNRYGTAAGGKAAEKALCDLLDTVNDAVQLKLKKTKPDDVTAASKATRFLGEMLAMVNHLLTQVGKAPPVLLDDVAADVPGTFGWATILFESYPNTKIGAVLIDAIKGLATSLRDALNALFPTPMALLGLQGELTFLIARLASIIC